MSNNIENNLVGLPADNGRESVGYKFRYFCGQCGRKTNRPNKVKYCPWCAVPLLLWEEYYNEFGDKIK